MAKRKKPSRPRSTGKPRNGKAAGAARASGKRTKRSKALAAAPALARTRAAVRAELAKPSMWRLGAERQELQARVARDRAARWSAYVQAIEAPSEPPGAAGRALRAAGTPAARQLRILAEGDSWFEYPIRGLVIGDAADGVIYRLQQMLGYPIANMAHHGDEVRQMLGLHQRREIISRLSDPGVRFDAMLFSGGGNDLVGDQFCLWLRDAQPGVPPAQLLYSDRVQAALTCVEAGYRDLVAIRDQHSANTALFFHGYDFPPVTGIGVCSSGPWLKPSLDFHQVPVGQDQFEVVRALLEAFQATLKQVASSSKDVFVVPTQGTLVANKVHWQNEIHPSQQGWELIAEKFRTALQARFP